MSTTTLKILNNLFKIYAPLFVLLSFSFHIDSAGRFSVLWRDNLPLALIFAALGVCMAFGWVLTSRRLRRRESHADYAAASQRFDTAPYNILGKMDPWVRRRMALAVFLTFSIIGPLSFLMNSSLTIIHPLTVIIMIVASGAIGASFILFGHKPVLLVASVLFFQLMNTFSDDITEFFVGKQAAVHGKVEADEITLTNAQLSDIRAQRKLVGVLGIILLASGYVMWLVVLNKEGNKRIRYQTEVHLAQALQRRLLPSAIFKNMWCEVAGLTVPATDVGGDYFDVIAIDEHTVAVVIADVAGHGIGAGILSAMTKSALRSQLLHDPSPVAVLENVNATLHQVAERKMFVTLAYALLDWNEKRAHIATAGHPPVLHMSNGTMQEVRTQSLALSMQRTGTFGEVIVPLNVGDSICLYTDGVTEAANTSAEQFGIERLRMLIAPHDMRSSDEFASATIDAVREFVGKGELNDDATIVYVRIVAP